MLNRAVFCAFIGVIFIAVSLDYSRTGVTTLRPESPPSAADRCLKKHGYFVAPATNVLQPVSDKGRLMLGRPSCSWSFALKSFLFTKFGRRRAHWIFLRYSWGQQDGLLRQMREDTSLGLTFYSYEEVAKAIKTLRFVWNRDYPDLSVNWYGKESRMIMTHAGFRPITVNDLDLEIVKNSSGDP